jgi:hypothetical protein
VTTLFFFILASDALAYSFAVSPVRISLSINRSKVECESISQAQIMEQEITLQEVMTGYAK